MNHLFYLYEPTPIAGSDFVISALSKDGSPYGIKSAGFLGSEDHDLRNSISLMPLFIRMEEGGGSPPNFDDFMRAHQEAAKKGEDIYGKGFFGVPAQQ
jgi:hypothetical protein